MKKWLGRTLQQAAWAPLAVFGFNLLCDHAFSVSLFVALPWLDIPTHFCGGIAITYFYLVIIYRAQRLSGKIPLVVQRVLAFALTAMTTILWEFLEFASDFLLHTHMNLGVSDTLCDMLTGMLGGAALLIASTVGKRNAPVWADTLSVNSRLV